MPSEHPFSLYLSRKVEDRAGCVGGSTWQDIYGTPPYGCRRRFRFAYRGIEEDADFNPPVWLQRGKDLEPFILEMWAKKTGAKYVTFEEAAFAGDIFKGDVPDWSWPHPDALVIEHPHLGRHGVVDAKCLFPKTVTTILVNDIPQTYKMQLTHYMAALKYEWSVLAILDFMNWELHEVYYQFDPALWADMKARAASEIESIIMGMDVLPAVLPNESNGDPNKSCQTCRYFHTCRRK